MTLANQTNIGRVEKIVDMLGLIGKSAYSQRADIEEVKQLLAPVFIAINELGVSADRQERAAERPGGRTHWNDIIEMARTAPLKDALDAMSVIATRAQEEIT